MPTNICTVLAYCQKQNKTNAVHYCFSSIFLSSLSLPRRHTETPAAPLLDIDALDYGTVAFNAQNKHNFR